LIESELSRRNTKIVKSSRTRDIGGGTRVRGKGHAMLSGLPLGTLITACLLPQGTTAVMSGNRPLLKAGIVRNGASSLGIRTEIGAGTKVRGKPHGASSRLAVGSAPDLLMIAAANLAGRNIKATTHPGEPIAGKIAVTMFRPAEIKGIGPNPIGIGGTPVPGDR
jgi:hypothetical protein